MFMLVTALAGARGASATALLSLMDNEGHFDSITGTNALTLNEDNTVSGSNFFGSPWSVAMATGSNSGNPFGIPAINIHVTSTAERSGMLIGVYSINDLSVGAGSHQLNLDTSIFSPLGLNGVDWQLCVDDNNGLGVQADCTNFQSATLGSLLFMPTVDGTFSLTLVMRFTIDGPGQFDVTATAAPEPGTLLLVGAALLAIVLMRRRTLG
jgi:hypothetical protein